MSYVNTVRTVVYTICICFNILKLNDGADQYDMTWKCWGFRIEYSFKTHLDALISRVSWAFANCMSQFP